jgi:hypothetical protein
MLNGTLVASVAASALTIAVKTLAGADPTAGDPVYFLIRDASAGYVVLTQTAALNIVVPSGATLGTQNAIANRIWVGVFNNSNTPVLGVYNTLNTTGPTIVPWNETLTANGTAIGASSPNPQVWYTASSVSAKNFRILGHVESTQTTAGTWAAAATAYLFGPGVKKPGDIVQTVSSELAIKPTTASATYVALTTANLSITPSSAANLIYVHAAGTVNADSLSVSFARTQLSRGTSNNSGLFGTVHGFSHVTANDAASWAIDGYDSPNTAASQAYALQGKNSAAVSTMWGSLDNGTTTDGISFRLQEIQI